MNVRKHVKNLVTTATHEILQETEDLSAYMRCVDLVNRSPRRYGPLVLNALKSRLKHKKHTVGLHALHLLAILVCNSRYMVSLVGTDDFLNFLISTLPKKVRKRSRGSSLGSGAQRQYGASFEIDLGGKSNRRVSIAGQGGGGSALGSWMSWLGPQFTRIEAERVALCLQLVQEWANYFDNRKLPAYFEAFRKLAEKGIKFPPPRENGLGSGGQQSSSRDNQSRGESKTTTSNGRTGSGGTSGRSIGPNGGMKREDLSHGIPPPRLSTRCRMEACTNLVECATLFGDIIFVAPPPFRALTQDELVQNLKGVLSNGQGVLRQQINMLVGVPGANSENLTEMLAVNDFIQEVLAYYKKVINYTGPLKSTKPAAVDEPITSIDKQSSSKEQKSGPSASSTSSKNKVDKQKKRKKLRKRESSRSEDSSSDESSSFSSGEDEENLSFNSGLSLPPPPEDDDDGWGSPLPTRPRGGGRQRSSTGAVRNKSKERSTSGGSGRPEVETFNSLDAFLNTPAKAPAKRRLTAPAKPKAPKIVAPRHLQPKPERKAEQTRKDDDVEDILGMLGGSSKQTSGNGSKKQVAKSTANDDDPFADMFFEAPSSAGHVQTRPRHQTAPVQPTTTVDDGDGDVNPFLQLARERS